MCAWVTLHTYTSQLPLMSSAVSVSRATSLPLVSVADTPASSPRSSSHPKMNTHAQATRWAITCSAGTPLKGCR